MVVVYRADGPRRNFRDAEARLLPSPSYSQMAMISIIHAARLNRHLYRARNFARKDHGSALERQGTRVRLPFLGMFRRGLIAAMAAAAVSLVTATSSTATVHPEAFPPRDSGLSFAFYGSTAADDVGISLGIDPDSHHIEDPAGVVGTAGDCQPSSPFAADCRAYQGHYRGRLRAGNDDAVMIGAPVDGKLHGGKGLDYLIGSGGDEEIYGGRDNDYLDGGEGADLIDGGPGADFLGGGINSDKIRADDGEHDARIDCGPGSEDVARIDRKIDPRPWGCERVIRVR